MSDKQGMTVPRFAESIGKSKSTVQGYIARGVLSDAVSRDAKGCVRIDPVKAALELQALRPHIGTDAPEGTAGDDVARWRKARADREAALAALAEDELRVRRGELVEARGVEHEWKTLILAARNKLLGIPTRARQQMPHLSRNDILTIENLIREALEDLASDAERRAEEDGEK